MIQNKVRVMLLAILSVATAGCTAAQVGQAQGGVIDLAGLARGGELRIENRQVTELVDGSRRGAYVTATEGELPIWIPGVELETGTIELEVKGKNLPGQSFLGVAFAGVNDSTFEGVYVRPFNFRAAAQLSKDHSIQYISLPAYGWQRLRTEQPEVFENPAVPEPDPDQWVRLRVVVEQSRVQIFVGDGAEPDLVVNRLGTRSGRRVGLWVGNNSDGSYANLRIAADR